jgi:hypothetical protein
MPRVTMVDADKISAEAAAAVAEVSVVAIAQRPHPRGAYGRRRRFHDAADHCAFTQHVIVVLAPLAGQAGSCRTRLRTSWSMWSTLLLPDYAESG